MGEKGVSFMSHADPQTLRAELERMHTRLLELEAVERKRHTARRGRLRAAAAVTLTAILGLAGVAVADPSVLPCADPAASNLFCFGPGTPARASEVNSNFAVLHQAQQAAASGQQSLAAQVSAKIGDLGNGNVQANYVTTNGERVNGDLAVGGRLNLSSQGMFMDFGDYGSMFADIRNDVDLIGTTYSLRPHASYYGSLGSSNYYWRNAYIHDAHIHWTYTGGVFASGNVSAASFTTTSDERLKENITPIEHALELVMKLDGYHYDLRPEAGNPSPGRFDHHGVLAQRVQSVLPSAVVYDAERDRYSVNYLEFIPVLIEAVKQQERHIAALQAALDRTTALSARAQTDVSEDRAALPDGPSVVAGRSER
jgi:hypothetical protein